MVVSSCVPSLPILLYSGLEGGVYVDSGIIGCSSVFIVIPISLLQTTNYLLNKYPIQLHKPKLTRLAKSISTSILILASLMQQFLVL